MTPRYIKTLVVAQSMIASSATSFDYVIVGGGPAGLMVANRLSANPNITVAVIEAGSSVYDNPNVTAVPKTIAEFSPGIGTSIDWSYTSAPQKYTANRTLPLLAGKALAGSTAIFGMTYLRAENSQIDAWEHLGNDGWNWDSMWPYYIAQEGFKVPSEVQKKDGASYSSDAHGSKGEIDVGFTPYLTGQGAFGLFSQTSTALGVPLNEEPNAGTMRGTSTWPMMLKVEEKIREDAARALYWPIADSRPNLHVFSDTIATRIIWDDRVSLGNQTNAVGLAVNTPKNNTEMIQASREIIVAAGSLRSPALLEHSGIGHPATLENIGIRTVVAHSAVGSNLLDQPANGVSYTSSSNWTGYGTFVTYLSALDLFGADLPAIMDELKANVSSYASVILADYEPGVTTLEIQKKLLQHQIDLIFTPNSTVPLVEILWFPFQTNLVAQFWNLLPLSRGAVHATSSDPLVAPSINLNFFQLPIDLYVQASAVLKIREFFATEPLAKHVTREEAPSFDTVPQNATFRDALLHAWIKETYSSNSHPVTSCAMMSEELGGVVDPEGKVYGTRNVRVVDASIFPTQISGHLTASIYAIAGKLADAILAKI
jgi:choline dehydrogenase-like flavoprotein